MAAVLDAAMVAPPGPVVVLSPPPIPCEVQTTFDWDAHLAPALRRAGMDRLVLKDAPLEQAALVVSFQGPVPGWQGAFVALPALDRVLWIGERGQLSVDGEGG
jgi:hypothetical protein